MSTPPGSQSSSRSPRLVIGDLYPLLDTKVDSPYERLEKVFDWFAQRDTMVIRLALSATGALLIALVTAVLAEGSGPSVLEALAITGSALVLAGIGVWRIIRLNTLHREYLVALGLLTRLRRLWALLTS